MPLDEVIPHMPALMPPAEIVQRVNIKDKVSGHATAEVKYHALFAHFYRGMSLASVGKVFNKSPSTIKSWVDAWENGDTLERHARKSMRVFNTTKREWLYQYFMR